MPNDKITAVGANIAEKAYNGPLVKTTLEEIIVNTF